MSKIIKPRRCSNAPFILRFLLQRWLSVPEILQKYLVGREFHTKYNSTYCMVMTLHWAKTTHSSLQDRRCICWTKEPPKRWQCRNIYVYSQAITALWCIFTQEYSPVARLAESALRPRRWQRTTPCGSPGVSHWLSITVSVSEFFSFYEQGVA